MKRVGKYLIIVLIALFVLGIVKDSVLKIAVEGGVRAVTGLPMSIRKFNIGLLTTKVDIRDLKIFNTKEFPEAVMLDMPEIYVDYDLIPLLKGKVHINDIRIDLKEFVVVKNKNGEVNIDSLKKASAPKKEKPEDAEVTKETKAPKIQIDSLELKIGKVIYKDYSKGDKPKIQEYNVNLNEKYKNISNPQAIVSLIVFKALVKTSIAGLVDLDTYKNIASGTLTTAKKVTTKTADAAKKVAKTTADAAKKAADKTSEAVKKTTESIKGILPFSKKE